MFWPVVWNIDTEIYSMRCTLYFILCILCWMWSNRVEQLNQWFNLTPVNTTTKKCLLSASLQHRQLQKHYTWKTLRAMAIYFFDSKCWQCDFRTIQTTAPWCHILTVGSRRLRGVFFFLYVWSVCKAQGDPVQSSFHWRFCKNEHFADSSVVAMQRFATKSGGFAGRVSTRAIRTSLRAGW